MNRLLIALLFVPVTLLSAMGHTGNRVKKGSIIRIDHLNEISTSSDWELIIEEGSESELYIESVSSNQSRVSYERGVLNLEEGPVVGFSFKKNRAILRVPELSASLNASSSSEIIVNFILEAEKLFVHSSSSGTVSIKKINAKDLELKTSSSGKIRIEELETVNLALKASSSGRISIERGLTDSVKTSLSSSGRVTGENLLVKQYMNIQGSSSSYQEFSIEDDIETGGSLSSSARLILHGDPSARALQNIKTSSGSKIKIQ